MRSIRIFALATAFLASAAISMPAQSSPAAGPPHASGTVKATTSGGFTLANATGDVTVTVPAAAKVLVVPPGSRSLKEATSGSLADIASGDRALVTGSAGDLATSLTATRVILMKAGAIASAHAADEAAWAEGGGGIVKSVDLATGTIVLSSGLHNLTITTTPKTIVRRYADGSVRFQDATLSTLAAVKPGDQLRVRGTKSADGRTISASEVVAGSFRHYSGLISSIDASGHTITLRDLTTKRPVTVAVTSGSDIHRLPPTVAMAIAARMLGTGAASAHSGQQGARGGQQGAHSEQQDAARRAGGAERDLAGMIAQLPSETLGGLKVGDAVMIVATSPAGAGNPTAVTLLAGVEPILTAPAGQTMTLSPWSLGGDSGGGDDSGGGGAPGPQ